MPSMERLNWLIGEISRGRNAHVSFSGNAISQKEKIKFVLDAEIDGASFTRPCVLHALNAVKVAMSHGTVSDKGHWHRSSNTSVVEFWIQVAKERRDALSANSDQSDALVGSLPLTDVEVHSGDHQPDSDTLMLVAESPDNACDDDQTMVQDTVDRATFAQTTEGKNVDVGSEGDGGGASAGMGTASSSGPISENISFLDVYRGRRMPKEDQVNNLFLNKTSTA